MAKSQQSETKFWQGQGNAKMGTSGGLHNLYMKNTLIRETDFPNMEKSFSAFFK